MSLINKVAAIIDSKKQIDEVTYLENQVSYDEGMSFLGIDLKSIIPNFPKNSSSTTENELIAIAKATKNRSVQELDLVYTVDKDPLGVFIPFLKKHNLKFDTLLFNSYYNMLEQCVYSLKYYYNRARPEQLAEYFDLKIDVLYTKTHHTPAYPSGHTMYAELIANILSDKYPEHKAEFFKLAKYCGLARILQGVHYPSDNQASIIATSFLYPKIKEYHESKRTQTETIDRRSTI
tara:strand:+ start:71 stop:772 length:702 start_codon:yes stop_codon:yes gene_type:complete